MKNLSKTKWAIGFAVLVVVAACGKTKLTEEQKGKVQRLAQSTSAGMSATLEAGNVGGGAAVRARAAGALPGAPKDSRKAEMTTKIRDAHCNFDISQNIDQQLGRITQPNQLKPITFKASGATCPVFMDLKVEPKIKNEMSGSVSFDVVFEIKDEELKKLSDVTRFALKGEFTFEGDKNGGSFKMAMSGEIISTELGRVALGLTASAEAKASANGGFGEPTVTGNMNAEFTAKFKDFEFSLEAKGPLQGEPELLLNGEKKTPQEVAEFFSGASQELPPAARPKRPAGGGLGFDGRQSGREMPAVLIPSVWDFL